MQREVLKRILGGVLDSLAKELSPLMDDPEQLKNHLAKAINELPYCKYIYVLDAAGVQIGPTIKHNGA